MRVKALVTKHWQGQATILIALTLLCGCVSPPPPPESTHPKAALRHVDGSEPISFFRIICDERPGTVTGHHYAGLLRIPQLVYTLQSPAAFANSAQFKQAATEELRNGGFTVLGEESALFGEDNSAKARFQLGATIKRNTLDSHDIFAGNFTESTMDVEWQLHDAFADKIVMTNTTTGYGRQTGVVNEFIVYDLAFRDALENLIATSPLADLVAKNAKPAAPGNDFTNRIEIRNPPSSTAVLLPADMDKVLQTVVVIKTGLTLSSGFLVSPDGYILTAAHCVAGVNEVGVTLKSGITLTATVIRVDEAQDVALIKLNGEGYPYLTLKLDQPAAVGNAIFAIGSPASEELAFSVTKGIVSGYRERDADKAKFIQTDASINKGNSGGPLLDETGKVIGIVSWKIIGLGVEGLSFGVPMDVVGKRLGISWVQQTN